jgi:hypothetical protein
MVPLQRLILDYERNRKIQWNDEAKEALETIKNAIANCPKIYFLDDNIERSPLFLHTDASDYGIGAYLFQVKDGVEYPLQFISKSFDSVQSR